MALPQRAPAPGVFRMDASRIEGPDPSALRESRSMHSPTPTLLSFLHARARELLARLVRPRQDRSPFVVWAEMRPIDFEGEDSSLRERDLRLMK